MGNCLALCGCHNGCCDCQLDDIVLAKADKSNTDAWLPPFRRGKVVSVYDGDTITVAAMVSTKRYTFKCRLNRIDTAEMRGSGAAEKKAAVEAKTALEDKILGKCVSFDVVKLEKYGRALVEVSYRGSNINDWLMSEKYAVAYDGGTKLEVDWATYRTSSVADSKLENELSV
jgi:endonuclease YncB( thermonuclease family)